MAIMRKGRRMDGDDNFWACNNSWKDKETGNVVHCNHAVGMRFLDPDIRFGVKECQKCVGTMRPEH